MPLDPHECHEYAQRCMNLAAETTDPDAQEILARSRPSHITMRYDGMERCHNCGQELVEIDIGSASPLNQVAAGPLIGWNSSIQRWFSC